MQTLQQRTTITTQTYEANGNDEDGNDESDKTTITTQTYEANGNDEDGNDESDNDKNGIMLIT